MEVSELGGRSEELELFFPKLKTGQYKVTSPKDRKYNCVAWAIGSNHHWWEYVDFPSRQYYWPPGLTRDDTVSDWQRVFEIHGYSACESAEFEPEFEKVAIYAYSNDEPTHVARQLETGAWTSKLGRGMDIEHETLDLLTGEEAHEYGFVALIMSRQRIKRVVSDG